MRPRTFLLAPLLAAFTLLPAACGGTGGETTTGGEGGSTSASTASSQSSAGTGGASSSSSTGGTGGDKSESCASTFGDKLLAGYGRIDGTVLAVVKPTDTQCAMPNSDHVVLQILINGEAYRMVINVQSDIQTTDTRVFFHELTHAMPLPPWSEGQHLDNIQFDYAKTLDAHSGSFTPYELAELSDLIAGKITLGAKVSVYADTSGGSSAHKIHRNSAAYSDGAIVLDPTSDAPTFLLFRFVDQVF